jgi:hypothetical protein
MEIKGTFKTGDPVIITHYRVRGTVETRGYFESLMGGWLHENDVAITVRTDFYETTEIGLDDIETMEYDEERAITDHERGVSMHFPTKPVKS